MGFENQNTQKRWFEGFQILQDKTSPNNQQTDRQVFYKQEIRKMKQLTGVCYVFLPLWTGNQGNEWSHGQVGINGSSGIVQLVFEGVRGTFVYGDIAIDDIHLRLGKCGQSPGKFCVDFISVVSEWMNEWN